MSCPQCQGLEKLFNHKTAAKELKHYRQKGPSKTTRLLIEALQSQGLEGMTLLDIGGGIGAVQHELLQAGASRATNVDASSAYIAAAKAEAGRQGQTERVTYHHGNFVDLVAAVEAADIVTLDRAICCYHDMPALVGPSAGLARQLYGLVYPRDTWWFKIGVRLINLVSWLLRDPFRLFAHPTAAVDALVRQQGLKPLFYRKTFLWQVVVYER